MALIVMIFASILKDRRESIRFSEEFMKAKTLSTPRRSLEINQIKTKIDLKADKK